MSKRPREDTGGENDEGGNVPKSVYMADEDRADALVATRQLRNSLTPSLCAMCQQDQSAVDPVLIAASANCMPCLTMLQSSGAKVSTVFCDWPSGLHCATDPTVLRFLREQGVPLEHRDVEGQTALLDAVNKDDSRKVQVLLELGASTTVENTSGRGLLQICAWMSDPQLARVLVETGGMDVNAKDNFGARPIETANLLGNVDMMRELLRLGADLALVVSDPTKNILESAAQCSTRPSALVMSVNALLERGLPAPCNVFGGLPSSDRGTRHIGALLAAKYGFQNVSLP